MRKISSNKGARGIMMQRIMKCGLIGGFILFIWGAISWSILPWQKNQIKSFDNDYDVSSSISNNACCSGLYTVPNLHGYRNDPAQMDAAKERMREGPYAVIAVAANGRDPSMVGSAISTLIVKIIAASLVAWLLLTYSQGRPLEYTRSVKFITVVGIVVAILSAMPLLIWFAFPASFTIGMMIEIVFGWFFAGLAIAKMTSPKKTT